LGKECEIGKGNGENCVHDELRKRQITFVTSILSSNFVTTTLCDCEYVCHAPSPPYALTQKKFPSTPTLHNGKKFSL
jgi:hypothetical protein